MRKMVKLKTPQGSDIWIDPETITLLKPNRENAGFTQIHTNRWTQFLLVDGSLETTAIALGFEKPAGEKF